MRIKRLLLLPLLATVLALGPASVAESDVPGDDPNVAEQGVVRPPGGNVVFDSVEFGQDRTYCAGPLGHYPGELVVDVGCHSGSWFIEHVFDNAAGTPIYRIRESSGLPGAGCLQLIGTETGPANNGLDAHLEGCPSSGDALWWFSKDRDGNYLIRSYLKNSAGRYPCLEFAANDYIGYKTVQVWDCPTSQLREWWIKLP